MRAFAALYEELDRTRSTQAKVALCSAWLRAADPAEAAAALWILIGERFPRLLPSNRLRALAAERTGLAPWWIDECYAAVGDLAETIALVLPAPKRPASDATLQALFWDLNALRGAPKEHIETWLCQRWDEHEPLERFLIHKLLTGGLRVGISRTLASRAVAELAGQDAAVIAHRLSGGFAPTAEAYAALLSGAADASSADPAKPYPFQLAHPWTESDESLIPIDRLQIEWKWDGIRAQLIHRQGQIFIWSRGEELMTERFPELHPALHALPEGTVVDGEILAYRDGRPQDFSVLQQRITRKRIGPKILASAPVHVLAYDLLEAGGQDLRAQPLAMRRKALDELPLVQPFDRSPLLHAQSWPELRTLRDAAREAMAEGLMLKDRRAPYGAGRVRGGFWKWKLAPMTLDAVLVHAEAGHGRRAGLFTSYGFAVWHGTDLLPVARAYSGLTDDEIKSLDRWIRSHATERFGPVRMVPGVLVFELAFEGIQPAPRRKAGLALRFPRILRWRQDKPAAEADRLEQLQALLAARQPG